MYLIRSFCSMFISSLSCPQSCWVLFMRACVVGWFVHVITFCFCVGRSCAVCHLGEETMQGREVQIWRQKTLSLQGREVQNRFRAAVSPGRACPNARKSSRSIQENYIPATQSHDQASQKAPNNSTRCNTSSKLIFSVCAFLLFLWHWLCLYSLRIASTKRLKCCCNLGLPNRTSGGLLLHSSFPKLACVARAKRIRYA